MSAVSKASTPVVVEVARPAPVRAATIEDGLNEVVKSGDLKAIQAAVQALELQKKITIDCFRQALPIAAANGNLEVFNWLREHKGTITIHMIYQTPVHFGPALCLAAANGHILVVKKILEARLYEGETSIAYTRGIPHVIPHETHKPKSNKIVFQKIHDGVKGRASFIIPNDLLMAVRMAAQHCHIPIVQVILSESKDLCSRVRKLTKEDPAAKGLPEIAALAYVLLHDRTLPPSDNTLLNDKLYETILFMAQGHLYNGIKTTLESPQNSNVPPGFLIRKAAEKGHPYVIEAMIKLMLPLSEADRGIAVQIAAEIGHVEIVRLLMDSGNISDADREIAATKAEKNIEIAQMLRNNPKAAIEAALKSGQIKL